MGWRQASGAPVLGTVVSPAVLAVEFQRQCRKLADLESRAGQAAQQAAALDGAVIMAREELAALTARPPAEADRSLPAEIQGQQMNAALLENRAAQARKQAAALDKEITRARAVMADLNAQMQAEAAWIPAQHVATLLASHDTLKHVISTQRPALPGPEPLPDAPGTHLKPDPLTAGTWPEFMAELRRYHSWAGKPSYRQMAGRSRQPFVHSTLNTALRSDTRPRLDVAMAVIEGCNGGEEDQQLFTTAWRQIELGAREADVAPGASALRVVPPAQQAG
jgi:hypothetical protein